MLKRLGSTAFFLLVASVALAQPVRIVPVPSTAAPTTTAHITLMSGFDLDGEAADADQVIAATALVDNGTSVADANWTIIAQPDVCRKLDLTIVDTNLTAGSITVTGLGCLGEARTCSFAFTAGDDTGTKTLTCTDGEGAYFATVSTVTTGAMTGESDETFALGYAGTNSANGWALWGTLLPVGVSGENGVDPFAATYVSTLITTTNALSTTVTGTGAFTDVAVGDLLLIPEVNSQGNTVTYERVVTARASADSITVNSAILIPTAGVSFYYKKFYFSTNPADHMYVDVSGWSSAAFIWSVDANADTGGVVTSLQCSTGDNPEFPTGRWVEVDTTTVATGSTQTDTTNAIDLSLAPFKYCRFGLKFGTGDDADAANEDINAEVVLRK